MATEATVSDATVTTEATVSDANTSDETNTMSSMGHRVSHMGDMGDLGMVSLAGVGDLHHGAAVASVSVVGHVLDPAVRERHAVLALDVAGLVPAPALAEVCVVVFLHVQQYIQLGNKCLDNTFILRSPTFLVREGHLFGAAQEKVFTTVKIIKIVFR